MKNCVYLILLIIVSTTATGCSRFRELTRRDYALLRDPFASRTSVAEASDAEAATAAAETGTSGVVKMNEPNVKTVSSTAAASYAAVAKDQPKSADGDQAFPGVSVQGGGAVISSRSSNDGPSLSDFVGVKGLSAESSGTGESASQVSTFMQDRKKSIGLVKQAAQIDHDFASWATAEAQKWDGQKELQTETASPLINTVRQVSDRVERFDATPVVPELGVSSTETADAATPLIRTVPRPQESAQPLIRRRPEVPAFAEPEITASPVITAQPRLKTVTTPAPPEFDQPSQAAAAPTAPAQKPAAKWNPFAGFDEQTKQKNAADGKSPKLDSTFSFDTGWKPSAVENP